MANLTTKYLGMTLKNPLVVSPSPLCESVDNIKRMAEAGAGAVVLQSLFEEQITMESDSLNENLLQGSESFAESLSFFPEQEDYRIGPEAYLEHLAKAKAAVDIPVIGSLNGISDGGWIEYAKKIEEAGADALELNLYFIPTDPDMEGAYVRDMYVALVKAVADSVNIPVAVKIGPYFTSLPNVARRVSEAGAKGLVLFNRFYQPDFDLDNLEVKPNVLLSNPSRLRLRLRWIAILYERVQADLALTGGVHDETDVVKAMMAGAKVAMTTSALLKFGIGHLSTLLGNLDKWLDEHEYESIEQMQGSMSQRAVENPAAFERANYMKSLKSYVPTV
jgi:dihydroorotate dehydrogenase (fumarate)